MKPIRIDSDIIVFKSILVRGVPTIPNKMNNLVNRWCVLTNRKVDTIDGDFDEVRYSFYPELTENEEEAAEAWFNNQ